MSRNSKLALFLNLNSKQFTKGLARASKRFKKFGGSMATAGRSLSMGVTAPLGALAAIAGKTAVDFEFAMAKVAAVAGNATPEALATLEEEAKRLGRTTAFSASAVAGLQLELAKLGVDPSDIVKMEGAILNLSQAFDQELSETAEAVGTTLNQFQLPASEATRVADVMAVAFGSTALDLERFAGSMQKVGPIAKDAGLSLEETTSLLGIMANNGITGADAGTKLKIALTEIRAAGLPVNKTLKDIAAGAFDFEGSLKLLGKRGQIIAPILASAGDATEGLFDKLTNASGAAQSGADTLKNTSKGALLEMTSALEGLAIAFGELLLPKIERMADIVSGLAAKFSNLSKEQKESVLRITAIASAVGPVIFIFGKLSSLLGVVTSLVGAISLPVLAAVAALAGLGYLIYSNWEVIVKYFTEGPGVAFLDSLLFAVNQFVGFFVGLFRSVVEVASSIWDKWGNQILDFTKSVLSFLMEQFGFIFSAIGTFLGSFISLFEGDWDGFLTGIQDTGVIILQAILNSFLFLFGKVADGLDLILSALGVESDISGFLTRTGAEAEEFLSGLISQTEKGEAAVTDYFAAFKSGFGGLSGFSLDGLLGGGGGGGKAPTLPDSTGGLPAFGSENGGFLDVEPEKEGVIELTNLLEEMGKAGGVAVSSIGDGFADAITGVKSFGDAFKDIVRQLIHQLISLAIGHLITTFLAPSPDNLATGGASGIAKAAAAPGIVAGFFGALKFAEGGAVLGPTLALIGENPASRGEFVVPFEKMGRFLEMAGGGQSGGAMVVSGRLVGDDIFLSNEKSDRLLSRRRVI